MLEFLLLTATNPPAAVAEVCPGENDGLAAAAVKEANAAVTGPDTWENRDHRRAYIVANIRRLFDPGNTGYLDFERYTAFEWASFVVVLPEYSCRLTFKQYMYARDGSRVDVDAIEKQHPEQLAAAKADFRSKGGSKGYIDKHDWDEYSRRSFMLKDEGQRGRIPVDFLNPPAK